MDKIKTKISLIIPVFNEAKTLARVLGIAISSQVDEILIIDDGSIDTSFKTAKSFAGFDSRIKVIRNRKNLGAGATRSRGIKQATGEIVVFVDSDIQNLSLVMIKKLYEPIIKNKADFSIASFKNIGRVTELTAKPLLAVCFPELSFLEQPISGQFASKKEFLFPERMSEENTMLGVLLDAYLSKAKIAEVNIGEIKHTKKAMDKKRKQAVNACRACIKRFIVSNSLKFVRQKLLET